MPDFLFWLVDPHLSSSRSPAKRRADLVGCTFSGLCVELCYCSAADHIPGLSVEHFFFFSDENGDNKKRMHGMLWKQFLFNFILKKEI